MIQKYEGFLSSLFKKKVRKNHDYKYIVELSNDCFIEIQDRGYTVKTKYDLNGDIYVQITKHTFYKSGHIRPEDIPYKFIDVKDDVLSFYDRLKEYDLNSLIRRFNKIDFPLPSVGYYDLTNPKRFTEYRHGELK